MYETHTHTHTQGTALGIIVAGIFFATIFHIGTREPSTPAEQNAEAQEGRKFVWYKWFTMPQFYVVSDQQ